MRRADSSAWSAIPVDRSKPTAALLEAMLALAARREAMTRAHGS